MVALTGKIEEKGNKETLVPLILKYIKPGKLFIVTRGVPIEDWGK